MKRTKRGPPAPPSCFASELKHFAALSGLEDASAAFGVDRATLDDPEAMVPITVYYDALERAAARSGERHFGFRFALYWAKIAAGGLGAMQFLIRSSPSLRVACDRILRYQRFWNAAEWYDVHETAATYAVRYRAWGPPREAHVHQAEKTAVLTVLLPRTIDPGCKPVAVAFPHGASGDDEKLTRVLGVTPAYGAPWTEVILPVGIMDEPLPNANPGLFEFMDRYVRREVARLPKGEEPYSGQVVAAVQRLLHEGGVDQQLVARSLGCSTRTLARRLAAEDTSLRDIVDKVRKGRATALLEGQMSISEVAFLLGYSEPAAFQHAFRRWHGKSPRAWLEGRDAVPETDFRIAD
ncbi:MAG TPA: AraC family transcriptional regulator ligand-binding domain-containing protein [Candidatus Binatia bacterium]|nr:AraC family transcriptional regulator ligand-binding domain-containing protein [Candidatus Binatia bacterium]